MSNQKKQVYMVNADLDDRSITSATLKELGHDVPICVFENASQLFLALKRRTPSIILLDYNATPGTGVEILKQLKSDDSYESIPVVVLTETSLAYYMPNAIKMVHALL